MAINDYGVAFGTEPITNKDAPRVLTNNYGHNQALTLTPATAAWLATDVAGTNKDIVITFPTLLNQEGLYAVTVNNVSTESDITVICKGQETLNGVTRYPELTRFGVAKNTPDGKTVLVQGLCLGAGARLSISNDSALTVGFTIGATVRKV